MLPVISATRLQASSNEKQSEEIDVCGHSDCSCLLDFKRELRIGGVLFSCRIQKFMIFDDFRRDKRAAVLGRQWQTSIFQKLKVFKSACLPGICLRHDYQLISSVNS